MDFTRVYVFAVFWLYIDVYAHLLINNSGLELQYNVTEYNHCLVGESRIQLFVGRDLDSCITTCALRSHCEALTYRPFGISTLCEIFQTEESKPVILPGCVFIQKRDIFIKETPCKPGCESGTTCNMETKSCGITECTNKPKIKNGQILGNHRAVGSKVRLTCDVGRIRTQKEAVCQPDGEWSVSSVYCKPEDCKDLLDIGISSSGVYRIYPLGTGSLGIRVHCDMDTPPGGWTVIQRRVDDRDFYKNWTEYKMGFGDLSGSHWLGNEYIWALTNHKRYRLRIDLTAIDGMTGFAVYYVFSIENETAQYALNIGGFHGNEVGDSLAIHNKMKFTTFDVDNDSDVRRNCAVKFHGAWWYNHCLHSNLNGDHLNHERAMGLDWKTWRGHFESLDKSEMKIYPT